MLSTEALAGSLWPSASLARFFAIMCAMLSSRNKIRKIFLYTIEFLGGLSAETGDERLQSKLF